MHCPIHFAIAAGELARGYVNALARFYSLEAKHETIDSSLGSHSLCPADTRLHLWAAGVGSAVRRLFSVSLRSGRRRDGILDVERGGSATDFEKVAERICVDVTRGMLCGGEALHHAERDDYTQ